MRLRARPIWRRRLPIAGDERADLKAVQNRAGGAPNLIAVGAREPAASPCRFRRRLCAVSFRSSRPIVRGPPFVRGLVARSRRAAASGAMSRNASRSLRLSSIDLGGKAGAVSHGPAIERARADRTFWTMRRQTDGGQYVIAAVARSGGAAGARSPRSARQICSAASAGGAAGSLRLGEARSGMRSIACRAISSRGEDSGGEDSGHRLPQPEIGFDRLATLSAPGPRLHCRLRAATGRVSHSSAARIDGHLQLPQIPRFSDQAAAAISSPTRQIRDKPQNFRDDGRTSAQPDRASAVAD